ncbi:MAG: hypothetical protein ACFFDS_08380 [Candidatus Thorarchaeota archaeon]
MRLASSLSLISLIIAFISLLSPVILIEDYVSTWIDLSESPPLWIFLTCTLIVTTHDVKWLEGIKVIRRTDLRWIRLILIIIAFSMSFSLELSVNVFLTDTTYWGQSILFKIPDDTIIVESVKIGYHLIRLCRLLSIFCFLEALIERNPRKKRIELEKVYAEYKAANKP